MKSNIVLVGLNYEYVKQVALSLCRVLDMFYLDIKDLIAYNLTDEQTVISTAGVQYYENEIKKLAISTADYENSVINFTYDLFINEEIFTKIKHSATFIFIDIDKKNLKEQNIKKDISQKLDIELIAFEEISKLIISKCDYVSKGKNAELHVENILNQLKAE
ncbi:MAG: hypothetical protein E7376_03860 [Clostridiales bacterium]|nr:hypothetical protein [Clostridiales bacterium]